jgi:hypothetical protein
VDEAEAPRRRLIESIKPYLAIVVQLAELAEILRKMLG